MVFTIVQLPALFTAFDRLMTPASQSQNAPVGMVGLQLKTRIRVQLGTIQQLVR